MPDVRIATLVFAAAALLAVPAAAQAPAGPRTIFETTEEGAVLVMYPLNCGESTECPHLALVCEPDGDLQLQMRRLQAEHEERFMVGGESATLWVRGIRLDLYVDRFYDTEEPGLLARLYPVVPADAAGWIAAIPGNTEILLVTPFYTFYVWPNEPDTEPMAAFADACAAIPPRPPA